MMETKLRYFKTVYDLYLFYNHIIVNFNVIIGKRKYSYAPVKYYYYNYENNPDSIFDDDKIYINDKFINNSNNNLLNHLFQNNFAIISAHNEEHAAVILFYIDVILNKKTYLFNQYFNEGFDINFNYTNEFAINIINEYDSSNKSSEFNLDEFINYLWEIFECRADITYFNCHNGEFDKLIKHIYHKYQNSITECSYIKQSTVNIKELLTADCYDISDYTNYVISFRDIYNICHDYTLSNQNTYLLIYFNNINYFITKFKINKMKYINTLKECIEYGIEHYYKLKKNNIQNQDINNDISNEALDYIINHKNIADFNDNINYYIAYLKGKDRLIMSYIKQYKKKIKQIL